MIYRFKNLAKTSILGLLLFISAAALAQTEQSYPH